MLAVADCSSWAETQTAKAYQTRVANPKRMIVLHGNDVSGADIGAFSATNTGVGDGEIIGVCYVFKLDTMKEFRFALYDLRHDSPHTALVLETRYNTGS